MKTLKFRICMAAALLSLLLITTRCGDDPGYGNERTCFPFAEGLSNDIAVKWYRMQLKIILKANPAISPLVLNRAFGYIGIGLYESVRGGIHHSVSLSDKLYQMPATPSAQPNKPYSWGAVANAALARLVSKFYPDAVVTANKTSLDSLEASINAELQLIIPGNVFLNSQAHGRTVADAIQAWSTSDNSNFSNAGYVPPSTPGSWAPAPPANALSLSPYFGNTRPLLAPDVQLVAPPFPIPYSVDPSSDYYKMQKALYDQSLTLTDEQKNIALYWNDVGVGAGYTPPGHAISILTQQLERRKCDLPMAAVAYALGGIALYDAAVVCWKSKYLYTANRPVTYIRLVVDPAWLPLIGTPPHPEYPAAHALVTGAFMRTLSGLFGDHYSFTDNTYGAKFGGPRSYSSFDAAAAECGQARYYGGIHQLPSIATGLKYGRQIGDMVNSISLRNTGNYGH